MKKITFNYDESSDQLFDDKGVMIFSGFSTMGYKPVDNEEKLEIKDICKLKEQGFDSKEIIEMHKSGVI